MTLHLRRERMLPDRTEGRLTIDSGWWCFTLEDPVRDGPKVLNETAIPTGRYPVALTMSERFHRPMPLVEHVPGFEGIRIHGGNTAADTSGCILLGMTRSMVGIANCAPALREVQARIAEALGLGDAVWLEIDSLPQGTLRA